jgi:hypothetical protein
MRGWWATIITIIFLALAWLMVPSDAHGACAMSYCKAEVQAKKRTYITNTHRQKVGDLYGPGTGRIQIRNNHRQIIGYVESDGSITNTQRQKIGEINE